MATTADEVWQLLGELIQAQKETERLFKEQRHQEDEQRRQEAEQRRQEAEQRRREDEQRRREDEQRRQEAEQRFQETERLLKEKSQETERLLKEQSQETERFLKEKSQETERLLKEQSQETERFLKEQSQKTDRQIQQVNEQLGKLGNRLGEFVEWQVRPAAVRLFQERGIDIHELYPEVSVQRPEGGLEIDLLVVNDTDAILIEVKSKLTPRDVDEHLERLAKFKQFMPRYRDVRALGAVAGMVVSEEVARYAYRRGLFVLAQSGDSMIILNDAQFQPQVW